MKVNTDIELKKPFVLDITAKFEKQLAQFGGSIEKLTAFYKTFDFDGVPYDGIKRWGHDSSTESSDISYNDIEEGNELWMRKYTGMGFRWIIIRITCKYGGVIFFETVSEKQRKKSYIDTGANDYEYTGKNPSRYTLPKHVFYPIEVIKPSWVNIEGWNAPKNMIITNK